MFSTGPPTLTTGRKAPKPGPQGDAEAATAQRMEQTASREAPPLPSASATEATTC
ncbi:hypothetical protein PISMIDRAFT_680390 [Pisolithus microcarpus 441]|uniref:Uncharacterized protein n=1 Tax=Pisolithus microcarpus 441 TaxID=765257 RepID=A0A0C9ZIM5_9AGAM|nr:hypothetical protein PISMIDRAFT_680390 [Pisolithus microcarpus 441]